LAIEGIIGVGKTSLVHRLHADMGGLRVLELVEENPFLVGGFYQDMERYAFNTEMFFLLARFRQQREVARVVRDTHEPIHSDYVFQKNRIFAELTLSGEDFALWRRLFDTLSSEIVTPDLVVYLRADTDAVMERINDAYERYFDGYQHDLLTIDVTRLDFVRSDADYAAVRALIDYRVGAIEAGQQELELVTGTVGR
jgi:deoxyguanosine kinase